MTAENTSQSDIATAAPVPEKSTTPGTHDDTHSKAEVCRLLGISTALFERLMRDGAPCEVSGEGKTTRIRVRLSAFVKFMVADAVRKATGDPTTTGMTFEQAKRKDKEVQAAVREVELLKMQGELVDINDIRGVLRESFATVRQRMLSVPSQITGMDAHQTRDLGDAINDALTDISEDRANTWTPDAATSAQQPLN